MRLGLLRRDASGGVIEKTQNTTRTRDESSTAGKETPRWFKGGQTWKAGRGIAPQRTSRRGGRGEDRNGAKALRRPGSMDAGGGSGRNSTVYVEALTRWLPTVAGVGVAFASGILVSHLHTRFIASTASKARRRAVGIIPARYKSSRFEGKPLSLILGKPMIQRTWERARLATAIDDIVVATDDARIADCCEKFGADVVMTPETCANGTERCKEAVKLLKKKYDLVVNIQGDEPLIDPEIIDGVVRALQTTPDASFSTAVTDLNPEDAHDPNRVKCIVDQHGYAIYFSRGIVPFNKKAIANPKFPYLLHLGIQCYDMKLLNSYPDMKPTPLQLEEDLEQLKVLENGHRMKVIKVEHSAHGVDVPGDIESIEALMRANHLS